MTALEVILKSRRDSVVKVSAQVAALDEAIKNASLTVKPVYEMERKVKAQRLARLQAEVKALEDEVARLNPELPLGPAGKAPAKR